MSADRRKRGIHKIKYVRRFDNDPSKQKTYVEVFPGDVPDLLGKRLVQLIERPDVAAIEVTAFGRAGLEKQ